MSPLLLPAMVLPMAATPAPAAPDGYAAEVNAWHQRRIERLKAEDGWLTLVGLFWLEEGDSLAGSSTDAHVALPAPTPPKLGVFTRKGLEVRFKPEKGAQVTLDGKPFEGGPIRTDVDGNPHVLRHGMLQILAIVRGDRVGIRVRDSASPARQKFTGIDRYPVRAAWRKEARFLPGGGKTISVPNVIGEPQDLPLAGTAVFTHEGKEHRLDATAEGDKLFFVFGDTTNKKETYGAGRFLYADAPKDGKVILDFNKSYNPPCVFTPYATCPLPPRQNKLPVRVDAGELRWAGH